MPIQYSCPHCGNQTTVADQYAGQSGPCARCGKTITVPFTVGAGYTGAPAGGGAGIGAMLAVLAVVLVGGLLVCGGIIFALMIPMRGAAMRQQSQNNLKQIGLAIHNYHDTYGQLPPAIVKDASGKPLYSGMVLLLPYLEQDSLYRQFDLSKAWDDPANKAISETMIPVFVHPRSTNVNPGHSDYLLVGGTNTMLPVDGQKRSMAHVVDGTSNTMMAIEVSGNLASQSWAEPRAWNSSLPFQGQDAASVQILMGDGSVRSVPANINPGTIRLLEDCRDGQPVNIP